MVAAEDGTACRHSIPGHCPMESDQPDRRHRKASDLPHQDNLRACTAEESPVPEAVPAAADDVIEVTAQSTRHHLAVQFGAPAPRRPASADGPQNTDDKTSCLVCGM